MCVRGDAVASVAAVKVIDLKEFPDQKCLDWRIDEKIVKKRNLPSLTSDLTCGIHTKSVHSDDAVLLLRVRRSFGTGWACLHFKPSILRRSSTPVSPFFQGGGCL